MEAGVADPTAAAATPRDLGNGLSVEPAPPPKAPAPLTAPPAPPPPPLLPPPLNLGVTGADAEAADDDAATPAAVVIAPAIPIAGEEDMTTSPSLVGAAAATAGPDADADTPAGRTPCSDSADSTVGAMADATGATPPPPEVPAAPSLTAPPRAPPNSGDVTLLAAGADAEPTGVAPPTAAGAGAGVAPVAGDAGCRFLKHWLQ